MANKDTRPGRRLQGWPYRHTIGKWIMWWDSYGDPVLPSVTNGEWHLIPDNEVGLYQDSAAQI